jgi:GGDEF domain-containing protein
VFDFSKVQFGHDGYKDSLTGADAQNIFYQNLHRSLLVRKRSGGVLFMITVKAIAPSRELKAQSPAQINQLRSYEKLLQDIGKTISKNIRANDFYTRMAVNGFYILASCDIGEESKLVERYKKLFADRSLYEVAAHKLIGDLEAMDWLTSVDKEFFTNSDSK